MNTNEIMQIACEMTGFKDIPIDSRIYVKGENIKKVLFGIDISSAEIKIAKDLGYDLVIAHHPIAISGKHEVYREHVSHMVSEGVPLEDAEQAVEARMEGFDLMDHVMNHDHVVSVAELLNMPLMNIHQPCDEMGRKIMQDKIDKQSELNSDSNIQDIINTLNEIEEFKTSYTKIKLRMGDKSNKAGKVKVAHGAYTNGGYEVANAYFENGIDTVVYIHIQMDALKRLRKENKGNIIVTGHIVSDEIGINPLIDELRKRGLEVDTISGLINRR